MYQLKSSLSIIFLLISFIFSINLSASEDNQLFLLPKESSLALSSIKKELRSAKKSIKVSIYSFTNKKLAKALRDSARRGVKVEVIFDEKESKSHRGRSLFRYLAKYKNITIYRLNGKSSKNKKYKGIMHIKMALIDKKTLIFGSANWTYRAFSTNYETIFMTKDSKLAKKFDNFFQVQKTKAKIYR